MDKKALRSLIKEKKAELSRTYIEAYSAQLADIVAALPVYRDASVLYAYLAYNEEILTDALIRRAWEDGKRVAVPKVLADGIMEFYYITSFDTVSPGFCAIPEPTGSPETLADARRFLMLMPGLAYGRDHNRIGYGGGYYDRYLQRMRDGGADFTTLALAYEFQIFDTVPAEAHDAGVDIVVTGSEILCWRQTPHREN